MLMSTDTTGNWYEQLNVFFCVSCTSNRCGEKLGTLSVLWRSLAVAFVRPCRNQRSSPTCICLEPTDLIVFSPKLFFFQNEWCTQDPCLELRATSQHATGLFTQDLFQVLRENAVEERESVGVVCFLLICCHQSAVFNRSLLVAKCFRHFIICQSQFCYFAWNALSVIFYSACKKCHVAACWQFYYFGCVSLSGQSWQHSLFSFVCLLSQKSMLAQVWQENN